MGGIGMKRGTFSIYPWPYNNFVTADGFPFIYFVFSRDRRTGDNRAPRRE